MPEYIGCGHIRLLLTHPIEYEISENISSSFIKSYFDFLWNHIHWAKLAFHFTDFTILDGNHTEKAVLEVITEATDPVCNNLAPLITPKIKQNSIFVSHMDSVSPFREKLASFFADRLNGSITTEEMKKQMDILASIQFNLTSNYLAQGYPVFLVTVTLDQSVGEVFISLLLATFVVTLTVLAFFGAVVAYHKITRHLRLKSSLKEEEEEGASIVLTVMEDEKSIEQQN